MESVFLVWHVHQISDHDEDEKLIGVYRTENDAKAAITRLQDKPGFRESPAGFEIVAYQLNRDHWIEGYFTVT